MELILNLLWFIVAVALAGFILRHQCTRAFRPHWGFVLVAMLTIAVLLFPAISASDDLYGSQCLSEDASRRALKIISSISSHFDFATTVALLCSLSLDPALIGPRCSGHIVKSTSLIVLPSGSRPAPSLRAPPVDLSL